MEPSETTQTQAIRRAARLLLAADYVTALTGAGISVESGIPPFRGPGGLWTRYGEPPMNGYQRFLEDPRRAWEERLSPTGPSQILKETVAAAAPNPGHYAFVALEEMGLLQCLITQNVDNLHRRAGSRPEAHRLLRPKPRARRPPTRARLLMNAERPGAGRAARTRPSANAS